MSTAIFRQPKVVTPMTRRTKVFFASISLLILAVAAESGIEVYLGGNKLLLIVPISVLAGVGMVALGLVNFENFVFTTIAIRSTLDITRPQAGNTGAAGVGNPTASGLDPAGALAVLFILIAFFWLLTRMREGRKSPPMSIHRVCLILFAGAGFLSIIDSPSPSISLLEAIRVTAVVVMLAVLEVMLVDREMIKRLIASIYVSALIPVGYTMFEVVTHYSQFTSGGFSRFEGTFSQPNPFAIYLTMLIVLVADTEVTDWQTSGASRPSTVHEKRGGLNRSMQHWLAVYSPESGTLESFAALVQAQGDLVELRQDME